MLDARSARGGGKEREDHPHVALLKALMRGRKASRPPLLVASVSAVFWGVSSDLWNSVFSGASLDLWHVFRLRGIPGTSCQRDKLFIHYALL